MIAIDPGMSGGFAFDIGGGVEVRKMPETLREKCDLLELVATYEMKDMKRVPPVAILEKVGGYMPGNSGPASVKFGRGIGQLEGILTALEFRFIEPTPNKWMRSIGVPPKMDKQTRKAWIREAMQKQWPHVKKITNATADALGMYTWARQEGYE